MAFANLLTGAKEEEERQELQAVLQSGILEKAPNPKRFLEYIAQQYFSGNSEQVKEYNIAVDALHRPEQFDPQLDTIVRVTAHTLRKKLEQFYSGEGAGHPIQIRLPAGKYTLHFEHKEQKPPTDSAEISSPTDSPAPVVPNKKPPRKPFWVVLGVIGGAGLMVAGGYLIRSPKPSLPTQYGSTSLAPKSSSSHASIEGTGTAGDGILRIRWSAASHPYTDVAGQFWVADRFCTGGSAFSHPDHNVQGTDDPALFQEGHEGKFQCRIPVPTGSYQLLLLFADTLGDKVGARQVELAINGTVTAALDVVDEAGGDDTVVGKVFTGIHPMSDGTIHLSFTSDGAFVNAAEITPTASDAGAPVRMLAGPALFHDSAGNTWIPERFFEGGRRSIHSGNLPRIADAKIFEWDRYGHFRYRIPVVAGRDYRVRLYFSEGWFGASNGGPGGIGSRVFDVYCDGITLLKDFDILQSQHGDPAIVSFEHVKSTAHGMLDFDFEPVRNYPLINAIEIEPE